MELELNIKAKNAEDLRFQIVQLANQYETTPQRVNRPATAAAVQAEASVFDAEPSPAPTPIKGKGKKAAAPAPTPVAEEPAVESEDSLFAGEAESTEEITLETIENELRNVISKCGGNGAREMMTRLGYPHCGKVPKEDYPKFVAACHEYIKTKAKKK